MSSAFTPISAGLDWHNLVFLNELILAYSERRQAIGQSAGAPLDGGADVHAMSFWKNMQEWLEANCTSFVDDGVAIEGAAAVTMFTLATWRAAAGLDEDGFRRATAWTPDLATPDWTLDPDFSAGVMQAGDIIGPWILNDLQKGFSALKWTTITPAVNTKRVKSAFKMTLIGDYNITAARADWNAESWQDAGGNANIYYARTQRIDGDFSSWYSGRQIIDVLRFTFPTFRPCACDIYAAADLVTASGWTFLDFDGLGLLEEKYIQVDDFAEGSAAVRDSAAMAPTTDTPFAGSGFGQGWWQCTVRNFVGVTKWNFTNSL
jgi:hypothetical protein